MHRKLEKKNYTITNNSKPLKTLTKNSLLLLEKDKRYPALSMSKKGFKLEREVFDFTREKFYRRRAIILIRNLINSSNRKYKLLKVISFFKLIAAKPQTNKKLKLKERGVEGLDIQANSLFLIDESRVSEVGVQDLSILEQQQNQTKLEDLSLFNELYKKPTGLKKSRNMIRSENEELQPAIILRERALIQRKENLLEKILFRANLRQRDKNRGKFNRWFMQTKNDQIGELLSEFENMNIVLSERAFREKMFRTKIKMLQNQIESQIGYFGRLLDYEKK